MSQGIPFCTIWSHHVATSHRFIPLRPTQCHPVNGNLSLPELPLDGNAIQDIFKMYMVDSGLLIAMLEDGTQFDVLQGNLYGYKGAIFEDLVADILAKIRRKLYYFHNDSGLEIDFVMRYAGQSTLLVGKATTGNTRKCDTAD